MRGGAIHSRPTSARRSGTSAHAEPPLWAHASNSVITVPTRTSFSSPAAIALVPSASPGLGRNGWPRTAQELLPAPYSHVTFTLPHQLCGLALQNPRLVYGMLFQAASQTLLTLAADPRRIGAQIGFLAVLHTWDQQMRAHPHLHCLVPAGGIAPDHSRWIHTRHPRFFLPGKVLAKMFRSKFLVLLSRAYRRNKLRLCGALTAFKKPTAFDRLFRQLKRLDWVVDAKAPFGSPEHVLKYLARYTHRVAISNGRLLEMQRWPRDLPLERLGQRESTKALDARRDRVHPPVPASHPAARLRQDPPFRLPGAPPPAFRTPALPEAVACASISESPDGCTQKPVEHRCPRCGIGTLCFLGWIPAGAVIDCAGVPANLRGFVLTLPMKYSRLSKHPRPPRTRSAERYPECVRRSLFSHSEPCFQPVDNADTRSPSLPVGPFSPLGFVSAHCQNRSIPLY